MKDTMRLKYDAIWVKPNMVNVNEMDDDLWNEWDGNKWRYEWVGLWYMKWMRWKWQGKYVTLCKYSQWNCFYTAFTEKCFDKFIH